LIGALSGNAAGNQPLTIWRFFMAVRKSAAKKKKAKPVARAKKAAKRVASTAKKATGSVKKVAKKASKAAHTATRRATKLGSTLETVGRFIEGGAAVVENTLNAVEKRGAARKKAAKKTVAKKTSRKK
jgi:hypothetical protein